MDPSPASPRPAEPLWRHLLGEQLRLARRQRGEPIAEVAHRANLSPQYLSEVERGRKEPSSEVVAALAAALDVSLLDLTTGVAGRLAQPSPSRTDVALAA
jgi:transcriptional regulator with XRE-family HTH domain